MTESMQRSENQASMTFFGIEEWKLQRAKWQKQLNRMAFIVCGILISGMMVCFGAVRFYQWADGDPESWMMGACFIIPGFMSIVVMLIYCWKVEQGDQYSRCPGCNKKWHDARDVNKTTSLGRCPDCSQNLFGPGTQQIVDLDRKENLLSHGDVKQLRDDRWRRAVNYLLAWHLFGVCVIVVGVLLSPFVLQQIRFLASDFWKEFIAQSIWLPGVIIILGSWGFWFPHSSRKLSCPKCESEIEVSVGLMQSGQCPECGERVIRNPKPGMGPPSKVHHKWTHSEFHQLAKQNTHTYEKSFLRHFLITFVVCLLVFLCMSLVGKQLSGVMLILLSVIGGPIFFYRVFQIEQLAKQGMKCPECDRSLGTGGKQSLFTRRCCHCGAEVIAPVEATTVIENI